MLFEGCCLFLSLSELSQSVEWAVQGTGYWIVCLNHWFLVLKCWCQRLRSLLCKWCHLPISQMRTWRLCFKDCKVFKIRLILTIWSYWLHKKALFAQLILMPWALCHTLQSLPPAGSPSSWLALLWRCTRYRQLFQKVQQLQKLLENSGFSHTEN